MGKYIAEKKEKGLIKLKYNLRKLSVGLVSCAVGCLLFMTPTAARAERETGVETAAMTAEAMQNPEHRDETSKNKATLAEQKADEADLNDEAKIDAARRAITDRARTMDTAKKIIELLSAPLPGKITAEDHRVFTDFVKNGEKLTDVEFKATKKNILDILSKSAGDMVWNGFDMPKMPEPPATPKAPEEKEDLKMPEPPAEPEVPEKKEDPKMPEPPAEPKVPEKQDEPKMPESSAAPKAPETDKGGSDLGMKDKQSADTHSPKAEHAEKRDSLKKMDANAGDRKVKVGSDKKTAPKTGVVSDIGLYASMAMIASAGLAGMRSRRKKP